MNFDFQIIAYKEIYIPLVFKWHIKLRKLLRCAGEKNHLHRRLVRIIAHART